MSVKRYVSPYTAGTESYRGLKDTQGRTEPDSDEGPFYVLAADYDALAAAARKVKCARCLESKWAWVKDDQGMNHPVPCPDCAGLLKALEVPR